MLKKLFGAGAALVSTLVAACDGAPTTQQVYRRHDNVLSTIQESTINGPMLLQIHGNPFVTSQGHLDAILTKELQASVTKLRGFKMTTNPADSGSGSARVIVVMGAPRNLHAENVCAGEPISTNTDDPIHAVALFCIKDELYSEVRGSLKASASPDDKTFRKWVRQIGRDLMMAIPTIMLFPDL